MRNYCNDRLRCVEVWLTHDEAYPTDQVLADLKAQHPGYRLVTFRSGRSDLTAATLALLNNNLM